MFSPELFWTMHGGEGRVFEKALSAAIVLGLYSGFMLAVAIAMVLGNDGLMTAAFLWGLTIVVCALILTPFLALGRKRGLPETDATVKMLREGLSEFNEGVGGWRALSHVRGEGMGASVSLSHASNPLTIIEKALQLATDCKLIFRFPKNDPPLLEIEHSPFWKKRWALLEFKEEQNR